MTPPLLYGAGNKDLLDMGGLATIGSRDATPGRWTSPETLLRNARASTLGSYLVVPVVLMLQQCRAQLNPVVTR
jgi:hypothetical protein